MSDFYPSKWGHTLEDAEFTLMLEPYPGTQVIYEHLADCPTRLSYTTKVYPPNTTLIVNNTCEYLSFKAVGEITKFVVESNVGELYLGKVPDEVYTKEVVIKNNSGFIYHNNHIDRVEIEENTYWVSFFGTVAEHIDVKKTSGKLYFFFDSSKPYHFDLWVDAACGGKIWCDDISSDSSDCPHDWFNYINTSKC